MKKSIVIITAVLALTGIATAASSTNEWIGISRVLSTATQWSPASAPTDGANIRDWLFGGSGFKSFATQGDLVVNSASPAYRVYADTVYIASGINNLTNSSGAVYDLSFNVVGSVDNRIVVKTGFDIASGVTNNVVLKSTRWASSNASNVITFNHKGSGALKIQNDWVETPGIALVYKGSAGNKVEFGTLASTYTGGTTLDNMSASVIANTSIGAASGSVFLTNSSTLNLSTFVLTNKVVAAAGSDVKTVISASGIARTSAIEANGNMLLTNSGTGTVQWNGAVTIGSGARLDLENGAGGVTQIGGTLSGSGTLRTSDGGTTVFQNTLDSSGFSGDVVSRGTTQHKVDNAFGSGGTVFLNGANLRGIPQANNLDIAFTNKISVQSDSRMALTTGPGLTGTNTSVTVGGDITFTSSSTLSLEAGGNIDNYTAANTLNINGVIKESASNIGNVLVDNHWTTAYYTNSITKFSAANTYHGKTDIAFGRLQLVDSGSIDNSSNLHVQAQGIFDVSTRTGGAYTYGGTVDGTGLIVGDLTLTGNLNTGNSPGTLTFDGALILADASTTTMEITDIAHDILMGNGVDALTVDGAVVFDFTGFSGGVTNGYVIALTDLFSNWSSVVSTGATYSALGLSGGQSLDFTGGNLTVIPEPATIGMLGLGALVTMLIRRIREY